LYLISQFCNNRAGDFAVALSFPAPFALYGFPISAKFMRGTGESRSAAGGKTLPFLYLLTTMPTPQSIIAAFDEVLEYTWGRQYGRDNPFREDAETAAAWIEQGVTLTVATIVFHEQMTRMHEKSVRQNDLRAFLPRALKVFDENIAAAIRRQSGGEVSMWDIEESRWRSRLLAYRKNPESWNVEQWGYTPLSAYCSAPKRLIREIIGHRAA
jgi:hypothetical protein